jgi:predicted small lipoprotein YifL
MSLALRAAYTYAFSPPTGCPMNPMRPLPRFAALLALAAATLAGCGTKTALKLPPPEKPAAAGTAAPAPLPAPAPATSGKSSEPY